MVGWIKMCMSEIAAEQIEILSYTSPLFGFSDPQLATGSLDHGRCTSNSPGIDPKE
jgi:hypothetical protein